MLLGCVNYAKLRCLNIIYVLLFISLRTLIHGDKKGGFTIFWADDGLDTGPILLQRECDVEPNDNVNSIYKRFLFPEGVKAMVWIKTETSYCKLLYSMHYI